MNDNWGYNSHDHNYKSLKVLIHDLVDIASKGGNLLLNVGPTAEGLFPPEAIDRLNGIGAWMKVNHDSIYDTTASVFPSLSWGRCTVRAGSSRSKLFLHVFDWPTDGKLVVPGFGNNVRSARILGGSKVTTERTGPDITISLSTTAPNEIDTVIELDVLGQPKVVQS